MTVPPAIPSTLSPLHYQPAQAVRDHDHLRWLAVGHYVYGGLAMLCSSVFIVHVVIGILTIRDPTFLTPPPPAARPGAPAVAAPPAPPPRLVGWMFAGMGTLVVATGWALGICTMVSGRCIARRRARLYSLIMAGFNCMNAPLGTALGVLTFLVVLRDSVRGLYEGAAAHPPAPAGPSGAIEYRA